MSSPLAVLMLIAQLAPVGSSAVNLTVRFADGRRQFRPGEIIPVERAFSSAVPKRFAVDGATYDRSGRLTIDDFIIEPMDDVSDPMLDYFASAGGGIGGGIRGIGVLGEKPFTVTLDLNERFRFDKPGTYTLRVRSRRVTDETVRPAAVVPVESNTISFDILPRDRTWEMAELDLARRRVDAREGPALGRTGCRVMRYLGTEAAALEMVRRYGSTDADQSCDFDLMAGLFGAPNRAAVVRAMEAGLRDPGKPVTAGYLRTLAVLSVYLEHPDFRPTPTRENKGRLIPGGELSTHTDLIDAALSAYRDTVTAALPDKTDRARAITLAELPPPTNPRSTAGSAAARDQLARAFLDLPRERQTSLLAYQWHTIAGPTMLPALRRLVSAAPSEAESLPDLALRRLAQLAPHEARPLLLRQIRNPPAGATLKTLGSLPDDELPDLDEALAANVEDSGREIHAALLHRYATKNVAPRILAAVTGKIGRLACSQQASVLAYFLRVDAVTGAALLDRAAMSKETGCWRTLVSDVAALRMTPALEKRAIADLDSTDPDVVISATKALADHGSGAALQPLRDAFRRWHETWSSRAAELAYTRLGEGTNTRQSLVEDTFRQAIGAGQGWLMRANDLAELQSLCVTDGCRQQTQYMIQDDDTRIMVWSAAADETNVELAQYRFSSLAAVERMLARYPRGTRFVLQRYDRAAGDVAAAVSELQTFAAAHGLTIEEPEAIK
jgi:hypothetical protein